VKIEIEDSENIWAPISDLMAGLMMVFILIAISYMVKSRSAAKVYNDTQQKLVEKLQIEFEDDLESWNAKIIDSTLSIQFLSNEKTTGSIENILFKRGKDNITPFFKKNLDSFFPKFLKIVHSEEFKFIIDEIRVEGHTSSIGQKNNGDDSYFYNMGLSQRRSKNVLEYCFGYADSNQKEWLRKKATANGLSYSKRIVKPNGEENFESSRRVEFRIKTNSESALKRVLN
tara:strand:- start:990 stop:1676 length:687 start_codon:yes stop_codon:yes gene_type:complete